jgi:DNA-binding NtrC family response regulator
MPPLPNPSSPGRDAPRRVLIVDDDRFVADSLASFLREKGYAVDVAGSAADAETMLRAAEDDETDGPYSVVVTEIALPGRSGLELIRTVRQDRLSPAVLALSGYGSVQTAVEAIRLGALDFLAKPILDEELAVAVERAMQQQALLAENRSLRRQLDGRHRLDAALDTLVGTDPRMLRIWELVAAVAPTRTTVLMTGESGTGKSLIARAIHRHSPRASAAFVELSCGSIPETLLESELFGHVKGAFTGAHADKKGRFLAAHGGTLFLDEINSASASMQLKLLRVLQERRFEPVGSNETIETDVRVVLASNQPLEQLVASGQFRQDLYYRINVVAIELPPLRDRVADIPHLANHFLLEQCREHGRQIAGFAPEAIEALSRYAFPGNVRELENIVERAVVLARSGTITTADLPPAVIGTAGATGTPREAAPTLRLAGEDEPWVPMTLEEALREPERRILLRALRANGWNRQRTADELGINRTTLYKKLKSLGLEGPQLGAQLGSQLGLDRSA